MVLLLFPISIAQALQILRYSGIRATCAILLVIIILISNPQTGADNFKINFAIRLILLFPWFDYIQYIINKPPVMV